MINSNFYGEIDAVLLLRNLFSCRLMLQMPGVKEASMKYSDIEDAVLFVSAASPFEHEAYLNKETGEAYYVSALGDSDELP